MKLHSHTKKQIAALIIMVIIFAITVLYSRGDFDFTFISRPDNYGSLNEVGLESLSPDRTEDATETYNFDQEFDDAIEDMLDEQITQTEEPETEEDIPDEFTEEESTDFVDPEMDNKPEI